MRLGNAASEPIREKRYAARRRTGGIPLGVRRAPEGDGSVVVDDLAFTDDDVVQAGLAGLDLVADLGKP